jgi:hypothetical protein
MKLLNLEYHFSGDTYLDKLKLTPEEMEKIEELNPILAKCQDKGVSLEYVLFAIASTVWAKEVEMSIAEMRDRLEQAKNLIQEIPILKDSTIKDIDKALSQLSQPFIGPKDKLLNTPTRFIIQGPRSGRGTPEKWGENRLIILLSQHFTEKLGSPHYEFIGKVLYNIGIGSWYPERRDKIHKTLANKVEQYLSRNIKRWAWFDYVEVYKQSKKEFNSWVAENLRI